MSDLKNNDRVKIFKLSSPISAHGENIDELELSEPTGKDIRECGFPQRVSVEGVSFNSNTVMMYVERLAKIPTRSVEQINPKDLFDLSLVISDFFMQSPPTSKS